MIEADKKSHNLLTVAEAALYLNISKSWLDHDRLKKPPKIQFVRVGAWMIRYKKCDLDDYIASLNKT